MGSPRYSALDRLVQRLRGKERSLRVCEKDMAQLDLLIAQAKVATDWRCRHISRLLTEKRLALLRHQSIQKEILRLQERITQAGGTYES